MDCISHLFRGLPTNRSSQLLGWGSSPHPGPVELLALGTGWTGSFLLPLAADQGLSIASTTRDGRDGTIPFTFNPDSDDVEPYRALPDATTVVIIFPFYEAEHARKLVRSYEQTRGEGAEKPKFILLGSTGIYNDGPTFQLKIAMDSPNAQMPPMEEIGLNVSTEKHKKHSPSKPEPKPDPKPPKKPSPWIDRHSPYNKENPRAAAEDAFLALAHDEADPADVSVLCLSGLWGHGRSPRRFIAALARTKEALRALGSVPLVHGRDVGRAILAMHHSWAKANGERWILTNERLYDLWDLAAQWGNAGEEGRNHPPRGPQPQWVQELIQESQQAYARAQEAQKDARLIDVDHQYEHTDASLQQTFAGGPIRALPRTIDQIGTGLDSSDFWTTFGITPEVPWVD